MNSTLQNPLSDVPIHGLGRATSGVTEFVTTPATDVWANARGGALSAADESTSHLGDSHIEATALFDDPIGLLVPSHHRFAEQDQVDLLDAVDEDWISGRSHQDCYIELLAATRSLGFAPKVVHYAQDIAASTAMVAAGLGIAAVPHIAITVPYSEVVQIPLAGPRVPQRRVMLALRRGARENPRTEAVVRALQESAAHSVAK